MPEPEPAISDEERRRRLVAEAPPFSEEQLRFFVRLLAPHLPDHRPAEPGGERDAE